MNHIYESSLLSLPSLYNIIYISARSTLQSPNLVNLAQNCRGQKVSQSTTRTQLQPDTSAIIENGDDNRHAKVIQHTS